MPTILRVTGRLCKRESGLIGESRRRALQNLSRTRDRPWLRSQAMDKPCCRQPNRFRRLIAFLRRRCEQTVPSSWLDEPPADPDIGVREPRRPRPDGGAGRVLLEPPP
jgi:hypothetical protein